MQYFVFILLTQSATKVYNIQLPIIYLFFQIYSVPGVECFNETLAVFWASFSRVAWTMGVSWVIFACMKGYGGPVNTFLSWGLFAPLSRLTYTIYLIHMHIIFLFHYGAKSPMHFDKYYMVSFSIIPFKSQVYPTMHGKSHYYSFERAARYRSYQGHQGYQKCQGYIAWLFSKGQKVP